SENSKQTGCAGFGPFRQFLVNPSWKAAQELKLVGLGENTDIYIKELPVIHQSPCYIHSTDLYTEQYVVFFLRVLMVSGCLEYTEVVV
uniref:Pyroglutamyl-peptidase I like n=1 Tax=Labrus bergylta TaxID=56723 RepID=A0A3Q3F5H1_9LABR